MKSTLCSLLGAASMISAGAETLSKDELLLKYAPVFEETIEELETKGYKTAPIETFFTFGSAEINETYEDGKHFHDKGKYIDGVLIETYGALPVSYRLMQIWGPSVGYHPSEEGLTPADYNKKLLNDAAFNIEMGAIRLSGIIQGSEIDEDGKVKDKNIHSYRARFFEGQELTDLQKANRISYIAHRGSRELTGNLAAVDNGTYEFAKVRERKENIQEGMELAESYKKSRFQRFVKSKIEKLPVVFTDFYEKFSLKKS